jgi:hypothetical protein
MASAMQLAIGLLIASPDSPELEASAVQACRFLLALARLMSHITAKPGRPAPRSKISAHWRDARGWMKPEGPPPADVLKGSVPAAARSVVPGGRVGIALTVITS